MRTPAAAVAAVALAAVTAGAAGCGGGGSAGAASAKLAWVETPIVFQPQGRPTDRVVLAKVRNASGEPVSLEAGKVVVRDASGKVLASSARYIAGYGHGLYGAFQKPDPLPPDELRRMGIAVTLKPGASAPISLAWRLTPDAKGPATVDWGAGTLPLPARSRPGD